MLRPAKVSGGKKEQNIAYLASSCGVMASSPYNDHSGPEVRADDKERVERAASPGNHPAVYCCFRFATGIAILMFIHFFVRF